MERFDSNRDGYNGSEASWHSSNNNNSNNSRSSRGSEPAGGNISLDGSAVRHMVSVMGVYAMSTLLDGNARGELRERCAERLRQEHGVSAQYAEQAVLANLDWGIDGLEKAVRATNPETKSARLEHTEKMLQVAVMLDPQRKTAGVPNSYLSAWANFFMALVWKLRNDDRNAATHLLEMFLLEPEQARRDFAPVLWEQLFRPHMVNIEAWYQGELAQIMSSSPPLATSGRVVTTTRRRIQNGESVAAWESAESQTPSRSQESDSQQFLSSPAHGSNGEVLTPKKQSRPREPSLGPDQVMRLELLNKLYQDSLDENTQQYAQYYKDWMAFEAETLASSSRGSPAIPRNSPQKATSQETGQLQRHVPTRPVSSNGASVSGSGTPGVNQNRKPWHPSLDQEQDSFSEASFKDGQDYSRNNSIQESPFTEEVDGEGFKEDGYVEGSGEANIRTRMEGGATMSDEDDDGTCTVEFERGAGVYLDGEELTEDELLQVWEELSEGRISLQEANDFISRLTDCEDHSVTFKKLSELAEAARTWRREHPEYQQPVASCVSPEPASPRSKYSNSPRSDIEEEGTQLLSRQGYDRSHSPEVLSRLPSNSDSSHSSHSSRSITFQQTLFSREQSLVRPPKDFVCPITNQLFQDPVTLETGQTYEQVAIKEWLDRGNTSCPITRQTLKNQKLPKTNYVLKRLVDNWKDEHPEYFLELSRASSIKEDSLTVEVSDGSLVFYPNSASIVSEEIPRQSCRVGQKVGPLPMDQVSSSSLEESLNELALAAETLFRQEDLAQCERAACVAAHVWMESRGDNSVGVILSKTGIVEGLMGLLSSSKKDDVLRSVVFLLSELIAKDDMTRHTIMRSDLELNTLKTALKNPRVPQSAVLFHLLKLPATQISALKVVPILVGILKNTRPSEEGDFSMCMSSKAAAVYILEQLVTVLDHQTNMVNAEVIVSSDGVQPLMERLEAKALEEKISAVAVMWSCLQSDGGCRTLMAQNLKIPTLVELLHNSKEQARTVAIFFLAELIRLDRRQAIEKILKDVLQEGLLNSMHVLMLHLQMSLLEHRPLVASLLLQLDILAEPRKSSVFREEALDALVATLGCEENSKAQLESAKALASLGGRFSSTGKPLTEVTLLKYSGLYGDTKLKTAYSSASRHQSSENEEKAAEDWDKRMAVAVLGSGRALIEALSVALPSKSAKLGRACVVAVAWLTCALRSLPDSGLTTYARNCFLPSLVALVQPGRDIEERVLACLSLFNLTDDPVGVQQLTIFCKDLFGPLRRLKRSTWAAKRILEALATSPYMEVNVDMWAHGEVVHLDASQSGEARALLYFKGHLYSGHGDASIKVWAVKRRTPRMVQEAREHMRAVLCLAALEEANKLFSGSADKTVRIWSVQEERIRCIQLIEIKEAVHSLAVNSSFICIIPQGVGVKVLDATGSTSKLLNSHKHVQSITLGGERLYCGCTDSSIQEINPGSGVPVSIQSGIRSLMGKKSVYSLHWSNNMLFSAGTIVDGVAAKTWNLSTRALVSTLSTQIDVRVMALTEDLIYLASNSPTGIVEVWLREKCQKVATFSVGSKVLSLVLVGETLYTGSVDGKLRAWALI